MTCMCGKNPLEMDAAQLGALTDGYAHIHVDVGTGSGKLVLAHAKRNPECFYIGLDPSRGSMAENAVRAAKQKRQQGLFNLLFVVAAIENPPRELDGIAGSVSVVLPWGSLRDSIVKAAPQVLQNLRRLGRPGTTLAVLVGYDEGREAQEIGSRALPPLSAGHFKRLAPLYRENGISLRKVSVIGNDALKEVDSDWAKRLAFGRPRQTYRLDGVFI